MIAFGIWIGGMVCYVLALWRDYRMGLPGYVFDVARARPARFMTALVVSVIVWPLSMVAQIALVDAQNAAEREETDD